MQCGTYLDSLGMDYVIDDAIIQISLVRGVLLNNGYSKWILSSLKEPKCGRTEGARHASALYVLPYYPGLSERIARIVCSTQIGVAYIYIYPYALYIMSVPS